jgi:hypothetical protein
MSYNSKFLEGPGNPDDNKTRLEKVGVAGVAAQQPNPEVTEDKGQFRISGKGSNINHL